MTNQWTRREFLVGMGASTIAATLPSCAINANRAPQGLSEAAMSITPVIKSSELEKPNLTIGYVPVNDCAPFAIAWEKGFFRKYGLDVRLSREASWATSRDGLIFGRLDASPVVAGAVTNARTGAEGARHAPMCAGMTIHHHGNAMTMNRAMWEAVQGVTTKLQGRLDEGNGTETSLEKAAFLRFECHELMRQR